MRAYFPEKAALPLFRQSVASIRTLRMDAFRLLCHACEPVQELLLLHREHPPPVQPQLTDPRVAAVHKVADQPLPFLTHHSGAAVCSGPVAVGGPQNVVLQRPIPAAP